MEYPLKERPFRHATRRTNPVKGVRLWTLTVLTFLFHSGKGSKDFGCQQHETAVHPSAWSFTFTARPDQTASLDPHATQVTSHSLHACKPKAKRRSRERKQAQREKQPRTARSSRQETQQPKTPGVRKCRPAEVPQPCPHALSRLWLPVLRKLAARRKAKQIQNDAFAARRCEAHCE